jgi:hypothetical protein
MDPTWVLLAVAVPVVATLVVLSLIRAARRRRELEAYAASQGWAYTDRDRGLPAGFRQFDLFCRGGSRVATGILTQPGEPPCRLFTHHYTVSTGKSSTTYAFQCALVPMPPGPAALGIRHEGLGLKLLDALGGQDIDFESHEFSKAYWVTCADRKFAYDAITPAMMEFLLGPGAGWTWVWDGPWLLVCRQGTLDVEAAARLHWVIQKFRALVPARLAAPTR